MNTRWLIIVLWLLVGLGCSGIRAPKERIVRNDNAYDRDLTKLQQYLGGMPVDLAIEGYRPNVEAAVDVEYSEDSVEAIIKQVAITQMDPDYTYLRTKTDGVGNTIRVPTKHVTRVTANGLRPSTSQGGTNWGWALPIGLGILAIVSAALESTYGTRGSGCQGGCLAIGIILGAVALLAALIVLTTILTADRTSNPITTYEMIARTWILQ